MPSEPREESSVLPVGSVVRSSTVRGVSYRIGAQLGQGGMGIALFALRVAPDGECPVVIKVLRPELLASHGALGTLSVQKEVAALAVLNERVPPTPYVVRYVDHGVVTIAQFTVPWVAVEHVYGGEEGTTLTERVQHALRTTGRGFDSARAAHAVSCLASGLAVVHEVGVIHRDIKPDNVLCCGSGTNELFKIADFGVARPTGMAPTFGVAVGTPGYAPPEQASVDPQRIGPWCDVFAMGAVVYYLLTGTHMFGEDGSAMQRARSGARPRLMDASTLSDDLRSNLDSVARLDEVLRLATAFRPAERLASASALGSALLPLLGGEPRVSPRARLVEARTQFGGWKWTARHRARREERQVLGASWDADGRCLVTTTDGVSFWDGSRWTDHLATGSIDPRSVAFALRTGPATWLIGGRNALAYCSHRGVEDAMRVDPDVELHLASGEVADLAVLVGVRGGTVTTLLPMARRQWLVPVDLPRGCVVLDLAPILTDTWLLVGLDGSGAGRSWLYRPLTGEVECDDGPGIAFARCAAAPSLGAAMAGGRDGRVLVYDEGAWSHEILPEPFDVHAAAIDAGGRSWAAGSGVIAMRPRGREQTWTTVWSGADPDSPLVAMFADSGLVVALSRRGDVLEGRAQSAVGSVADERSEATQRGRG